MTDPTLRVLIPSEKIQARIKELGEQISRDYPEGRLHMIAILKGAAFFLADLTRAMKRDVYIDFMGISSYGKGKTSSGEVKVTKDLDISLEGAEVLIVEDIVDSGITLNYLMHVLDQRQAAFHPHRGAAGQARAPLAAGARELRGIPDSGPVRGGIRPGFRREVPQPGRYLRAGRRAQTQQAGSRSVGPGSGAKKMAHGVSLGQRVNRRVSARGWAAALEYLTRHRALTKGTRYSTAALSA